MSDITVLGPELFANADASVISFKGENFYRACDHLVKELPDGGASYCVKRVNHPGRFHEDFNGRTYCESAKSELSRAIYGHIPAQVNPAQAKEAAEQLASKLIEQGWKKE